MMFNRWPLVLSTLIFSLFTYAQVEERHVDFTISPAILAEGKIHVAYEWLRPQDIFSKNLNVIDIVKVAHINPGLSQLVAAKLALISKQPFDQLTYKKMNTASYISSMLNSVSIKQKSSDVWSIENKVKAFQVIPVKVGFQFKFTEVQPSQISANALKYLRDEASAIKSNGRERILILDMTQFSQLIYRNYSLVYMKELNTRETLIVAGVITALDIQKANAFFDHPPFSNTEQTLMSNMRTQILHMGMMIQKPIR
jgi:hypothetical protein